jgi:hypothetical protein
MITQTKLNIPLNSSVDSDRLYKKITDILGIRFQENDRFLRSLPFSEGDTTAGAENELQTAVRGDRFSVDLPVTIENSNFYRNIITRVAAGETPRQAKCELEHYLETNEESVWENSWVRFPRRRLSSYARNILDRDLRSDKSDINSPYRKDIDRFIYMAGGEEHIRIPISYLLKLSLADCIGSLPGTIDREPAAPLMDHFLNDNTSPETFSFSPVLLNREGGMGKALAGETARRYLLTQLLVNWANSRFGLHESGQDAVVYNSPTPPVRQKHLNDIISDSFYRDLFMSPCLSGWDRGEEKHRYMVLCHQVLSRSHLNIIPKLREAGIIQNNLVSLPNVSNISLANNGTHISIGSRKLTSLMNEKGSGMTPEIEKYTGDLVIKTVEHFLPLMVSTYTASPYRLNFWDFHPEKVLGFLPHELTFTHLRMIWRRWKKKAGLKIFGRPVLPTGIEVWDRFLSRVLMKKGDFIPDFRLIDYLVAIMSSDRSPGLNGIIGNDHELKKDLADMGIFDEHMSLYQLYKIRDFASRGFTGYEGRFYSLFPSFMNDMSHTASLQNLITALAYKYIATGQISHSHIPDDLFTESERRQIFFGAAIGIPTYYIKKETQNLLMLRIVSEASRTRMSSRYPGYIRIHLEEYLQALVRIIRADGADLIEQMGMEDVMRDLEYRISNLKNNGAAGKITSGILDKAGTKSPMSMKGDRFNAAAEAYYREDLRREQLEESLDLFIEETYKLKEKKDPGTHKLLNLMHSVTEGRPPADFLKSAREDIITDTLPEKNLSRVIQLLISVIMHDQGALSGQSIHKKQRVS